MAKRDTHRYALRHGRHVVQYGITSDLDRRQAEHEADGKKFTSMNTVGPKVSRETAESWEKQKIDSYKRGHGGRAPKYNKT